MKCKNTVKQNKHTEGRTPHGVRGLKSTYSDRLGDWSNVAPLTGCVD